jgi:hypothetical protein
MEVYLTKWPYRCMSPMSPEGVKAQEPDAGEDGPACRGNEEDRGQDRPDAGCPAQRKGDPHEEGTEEADRFLVHVNHLLLVQETDFHDIQHVETHDYEENAAYAHDPLRVLGENVPQK